MLAKTRKALEQEHGRAFSDAEAQQVLDFLRSLARISVRQYLSETGRGLGRSPYRSTVQKNSERTVVCEERAAYLTGSTTILVVVRTKVGLNRVARPVFYSVVGRMPIISEYNKRCIRQN